MDECHVLKRDSSYTFDIYFVRAYLSLFALYKSAYTCTNNTVQERRILIDDANAVDGRMKTDSSKHRKTSDGGTVHTGAQETLSKLNRIRI